MLSSEVADFGSSRLFGSVPTPPLAVLLVEPALRICEILHGGRSAELLEKSQRAELCLLLILHELGLGGVERGLGRIVGALRGCGVSSRRSGVRICGVLGLLRRDKIREGFR